jgi:YfiH family protein
MAADCEEPRGEALRAACLSGFSGVHHGFFTRNGGVSSGWYGTLNCGLGSSDDRAKVEENRARVARALSAAGAPVVTLYQVHSAVALTIDRPFPAGSRPRADALVTRTPGLVIGALAADCAPVLFLDPEARIIAAAHAGWRGALGGILESTIDAMVALGASRATIRAAVGPCINQPAYEVGPEFEAGFLRQDPASEPFFARTGGGGRPRFDLPGYVAARLGRAGVGCVERCSPCTYENESLFYSYRRSQHRKEPDYGRQISAIVLT